MVAKGAYVVSEAKDGKAELILIASGSEVGLAMEAQKELEAKGTATRVVSIPSWELFDEQPQEYKDEVLPPDVTSRLSIEAGSPIGWEKYVGDKGDIVGITTFGASAPANIMFEKYGFTVSNVVELASKLLA